MTKLNPTDLLDSSYKLYGNSNNLDLNLLDTYIQKVLSRSSNESDINDNDVHSNDNEEDATDEIVIEDEKENYTDPIVEFNPTYETKPIILSIDEAPDNMKEDGNIDSNNKDEMVNNIEDFPFYEIGYIYPLINFNGRILSKKEIASIDINFDDIVPTMTLYIYDLGLSTESIRHVQPGLYNEVIVKIRPQINGKYSAISLIFFVKEFNHIKQNGAIMYKAICSYKLNKLYDGTPIGLTITWETIKYLKDNNPYLLRSFDYLGEIAYKCKLGFQSTENCEYIKDERLRYKQNETYIDFIKKQLSISGVDEHSVLDCWVNMYGYLTLINVSWVFEQFQKITPKLLTCYANTGIMQSNGKGIGQEWKKVYRTLSNLNLTTRSSMTFSDNDYMEITDTEFRNKGINQSVYTFGEIGTGTGNNGSINQIDITGIGNDVDAKKYKDDYDIKSYPNTEINCSDNINIINQRTIIKTFFAMKRSKKVILTLHEINFALDRGYLVNIAYFVTNKTEKSFILSNYKNLAGDESTDKKEITLPSGKTVREVIEDDFYPILDMEKSGIFYIDKMYIHYDSEHDHLVQKLELIKIGNTSTYQNKYSGIKTNKEQSGDLDSISGMNSSNTISNTDAEVTKPIDEQPNLDDVTTKILS